MPERKGVARRQARVREILHTLPPKAQEVIRDDLEGTHAYPIHEFPDAPPAHHADETPTGRIPVADERCPCLSGRPPGHCRSGGVAVNTVGSAVPKFTRRGGG